MPVNINLLHIWEGSCYVTTFVRIDRARQCVRCNTGLGGSTQPSSSRVFRRFDRSKVRRGR